MPHQQAADAAPVDATPERIAKAANDNFVGKTGARRFKDSPLERLAMRNALWPDARTNALLAQAGMKFHRSWYMSGMNPLAAFDYGKVGGGGGGGMPFSVAQAHHRKAYRAACNEIGTLYADAVEKIVCHEQEVIDVGFAAGVKSPNLARALGLERLRAGLYMLARHYGLLS